MLEERPLPIQVPDLRRLLISHIYPTRDTALKGLEHPFFSFSLVLIAFFSRYESRGDRISSQRDYLSGM